MSETRSLPRFNHVAMSVPASTIDANGRSELLDFYGEVFGWVEMPTMTREGEVFVLRAYRNDQFVFLVADDEPMRCPSLDHFGMSVSKPEELQEMIERAKAYRERDSRVEIIEAKTEDFRAVKLHSFYVRFLLPMMIEVQCFEWADGVDPTQLPRG
ncbi:hypothetical protein MK489_00210 [Myxococcota bacterium]|nr:hypothetical protein [Myxococcota bacterium]